MWILGLAQKLCRAEQELALLLLWYQVLCAIILCYSSLDFSYVFNRAAQLYRKKIFPLLCLCISELWIATFFFLNILDEGRPWTSQHARGLDDLPIVYLCVFARPCLFIFSPLLCSEPCYWSQKATPSLQLTKTRLKVEERGQSLTWECHVVATINSATLCNSLKGLLSSCAVWKQICCPEKTKKNKPIVITTLFG